MKPILIGEQNPYGPDAEFALFPRPRGCSGWRLCWVILEMTERDYLRQFDRVNLCDGPWRAAGAAEAAARLLETAAPKVLLGARVAGAFDLPFEPFRQTWWPTKSRRGPMLVLPHPSGRCRIWNVDGNYALAREAVSKFLEDAT